MFPEFVYDDILHIKISCTAGYIRWCDLYDIYDKDEELKSNLRKAPTLSYLALHPQRLLQLTNKKKSVNQIND